MEKLRACVLGATGLVGQHLIKLLEHHPYFDLECLTASDKSVGKKYKDASPWLLNCDIPEYIANKTLSATSTENITHNRIDVVFSALPGALAGNIETQLVQKQLYVFSNASSHRMGAQVPILCPEINPEHLQIVKMQNVEKKGFIVTNSNCTTSGVVFGLKPLVKHGIESVFVTSYQAVSGAGRQGIAALSILGNVIPYIQNEESKVAMETKKILGTFKHDQIEPANFYVNASCARVPVMYGHLISLAVKLTKEIGIEDAIREFISFKGEPQQLNLPTAPKNPLIVRLEDDRPQPAKDLYSSDESRAQGMSVSIGRIRMQGKYLNFYLLVHNTIRGAAGATLLNAEFSFAKQYLQ